MLLKLSLKLQACSGNRKMTGVKIADMVKYYMLDKRYKNQVSEMIMIPFILGVPPMHALG
jgi:hypothetical protein